MAQDAVRETPTVLTKAVQVRALSADEAELKHAVRLRGVVTLVYLRGTFFLQDDSGGILINTSLDAFELRPGDLIEIEGISDYGSMVPRVRPVRWTVLGRSPLPEPVRISSDDLVAGRHVSEWVELTGVVRGAHIGSGSLCVMRVDAGARVVEVQLVEAGMDEVLALVDARVRVRGVIAGYVNERRQLASLYVRSSGLASVEILEPPPDLFSQPATPVPSLMMFSPQGSSSHRIKVRGVVAGYDAGSALFLRDGRRGLVVFSEQRGELVPGDVVEVSGFPEMGPTNPRLHDAVFRWVEGGPPPSPRQVGRDELLRGLLDGELVAVVGRLVSSARISDEITLVLDIDGMTLHARLKPGSGADPAWMPGSLIRVTGICRVQQAERRVESILVTARDVELWLRQAADVTVLQVPSWWTVPRLFIVLAVAAGAALTALGWVALLRRRVRQQTAIIREKVQNEAVVEERQRIAREFHDTLEQELAGLAVRLDALQLRVTDAGNAGLVLALQRLAHRLQDEARHFIWNLRERRWENTTLDEALADAVAERHGADDVRIELERDGEVERLSGIVSHHLLRIGQEAVTNAVQHAAATVVRIRLRFQPDEVTLTVEDDGRGFDANLSTGRRAGHFGITGMRERARRIGGDLRLRSEPGRGTTVSVRVAPERRPS